MRRTKRRDDRPLLKGGNPRDVLKRLIAERYPIYGEADIILDVDDEPVKESTERLIEQIASFAQQAKPVSAEP